MYSGVSLGWSEMNRQFSNLTKKYSSLSGGAGRVDRQTRKSDSTGWHEWCFCVLKRDEIEAKMETEKTQTRCDFCRLHSGRCAALSSEVSSADPPPMLISVRKQAATWASRYLPKIADLFHNNRPTVCKNESTTFPKSSHPLKEKSTTSLLDCLCKRQICLFDNKTSA